MRNAKFIMPMEGVVVHCPDEGHKVNPAKGSAGIRSHVAGASASVSNLAAATGGIGKFIMRNG